MARSQGLQLFVATILLLAASGVQPRVEYDNTLSRFYLLSAAVDRGTLSIEDYPATPDSSVHDGRTYSNKAFGLPLLAAPIYAALRAVPATRGSQPLSRFHRWMVRVTTVGLPFAICGSLLATLAFRMGANEATALRSTLACGVGTLAWEKVYRSMAELGRTNPVIRTVRTNWV